MLRWIIIKFAGRYPKRSNAIPHPPFHSELIPNPIRVRVLMAAPSETKHNILGVAQKGQIAPSALVRADAGGARGGI
jgi:hypothetical protein